MSSIEKRYGIVAALAVVIAAAIAAPVRAQPASPASRFTFAVVGHVRGAEDASLHPHIDELIDALGRARPDIVFLAGDSIWGSLHADSLDRAGIEAQWNRLDAKLKTLGVPVHRVPGNHDIHDPITRDVFFERYGAFPRVLEYGGARFLLLNSTFTPQGDGPAPKFGSTFRLDADQVRFVQQEVSRGGAAPTFLLMHHVLWFYDDDPWWTEVHPLIAGKVAAVFSGDLGPAMYTHLTRDGVDYFRTTLNAPAPSARATTHPSLLIRTAQFENFVVGTVDGSRVSYEARTVGGVTSDAFSPERWRVAFGPERDPAVYWDPARYRPPSPRTRPAPATRSGIRETMQETLASPRRLAALTALVGLSFAGGFVAGRRRRRRGASHSSAGR